MSSVYVGIITYYSKSKDCSIFQKFYFDAARCGPQEMKMTHMLIVATQRNPEGQIFA